MRNSMYIYIILMPSRHKLVFVTFDRALHSSSSTISNECTHRERTHICCMKMFIHRHLLVHSIPALRIPLNDDAFRNIILSSSFRARNNGHSFGSFGLLWLIFGACACNMQSNEREMGFNGNTRTENDMVSGEAFLNKCLAIVVCTETRLAHAWIGCVCVCL